MAWRCPHCGHNATIRDSDSETSFRSLDPGSKHGIVGLTYSYIRCPNEECRDYELTVKHVRVLERVDGNRSTAGELSSWRFHPQSRAQVFPGYIPEQIRQDYEEACLIAELSPKASATLSRRALQGILRDFWKVKPARLVAEIAAIKDKCDPLTWEAIEAVRKVGNIGAHMEADVDVIVDVDPGEADLLLTLIETVIRDWYIAKEARRARLQSVADLARRKEAERKVAKEKDEEGKQPTP